MYIYFVVPVTEAQGTEISVRFRKDLVNTGTLNMEHQESGSSGLQSLSVKDGCPLCMPSI